MMFVPDDVADVLLSLFSVDIFGLVATESLTILAKLFDDCNAANTFSKASG